MNANYSADYADKDLRSSNFVPGKISAMRSNMRFQVGLIGHGSWATAIAKILTDNHFKINWLIPRPEDIACFRKYRHAPRYLTSVRFDLRKISFYPDAVSLIRDSDWVVLCMPAAFLEQLLESLSEDVFTGKCMVSGVKGILPESNLLLNDYLEQRFKITQEEYFCIAGPCHAEEVAAEKLSYLTFSGKDKNTARKIAARFTTPYLKTIVTGDVYGTQYAAVLKNIYAIGAGMAGGLGYGDNFLAVYMANCAAEMAGFIDVVSQSKERAAPPGGIFASAYLGDLLVTCYSQHSRNRTFGAMIGKGYSVRSAQLEMNMVAEGYHAARCMERICSARKISLPVARTIYRVLWEQHLPREAFEKMSGNLR